MTPFEIYVICIAANGFIVSWVLLSMNMRRQALPPKIDHSSIIGTTLLAPISIILYFVIGVKYGIRWIQNKQSRRKRP